MRHTLMLVAALALASAGVSFILAEDLKQPAKDAAAAAAQSQTAAVARLRAQMHRAMAALIEAQSADKPDQAKIEQLAAEIRDLRAKLAAQCRPGTGATPPMAALGPGWRCPWGGPGCGPGWGAGLGRGAGWGAGMGSGRGWGTGPARRPGWGPGPGRGLGFIDLNQNGICDLWEALWGK